MHEAYFTLFSRTDGSKYLWPVLKIFSKLFLLHFMNIVHQLQVEIAGGLAVTGFKSRSSFPGQCGFYSAVRKADSLPIHSLL